MINRLTNC